MDKIIHKANERGYSNHGWLKSYHSFSFVNYVNPDRIHFGALRVLNDDTVDVGRGFGMHPHKNMEIISCRLDWLELLPYWPWALAHHNYYEPVSNSECTFCAGV